MINISDLQRYILDVTEAIMANWEIAIWLGLNCMFWGGLIIYAVVSVKTRKRKSRRFSREKIFDRVKNSNLNLVEKKILSKLFRFLIRTNLIGLFVYVRVEFQILENMLLLQQKQK